MDRGQEQSHRNSFLLPMLCRLSIKDVRFSHTEDRSGDPSSPKVSCMGQVRRKNRAIGSAAATATRTNNINQHPHMNYTKLIAMFSRRNLAAPSNACVSSGGRRSGSKSCTTSREMISASTLRMRRLTKCDRDGLGGPGCAEAVFDVCEMDPPLPVIKRVVPPGVDEVNIWKRRFNGVALQSLQIDQIHSSKSRFLPPTTV